MKLSKVIFSLLLTLTIAYPSYATIQKEESKTTVLLAKQSISKDYRKNALAYAKKYWNKVEADGWYCTSKGPAKIKLETEIFAKLNESMDIYEYTSNFKEEIRGNGFLNNVSSILYNSEICKMVEDCAHFISNCIGNFNGEGGGIDIFEKDVGPDGVRPYYGKASASALGKFLEKNVNAIVTKNITSFENCSKKPDIGDVLIFKNAEGGRHTTMVVDKLNVGLVCHSFERFYGINRPGYTIKSTFDCDFMINRGFTIEYFIHFIDPETPPSEPKLSTPILKKPVINESFIYGKYVTFQWEKVQGSEIKYDLLITNTDPKTKSTITKNDHPYTSILIGNKSDKIPPGEYTWKVMAKDSSGNKSNWSEERPFSVKTNTGTIKIYASCDGILLSGIGYELSGPMNKSGTTSSEIITLQNCPIGMYSVTWGDNLADYERISLGTPFPTTLQSGSTISFCAVYKKKVVNTATIKVKSMYRGEDWVGSLTFRLTGPTSIIDGFRVPAEYNQQQTGTWSLSVSKGGPRKQLPTGSWLNAKIDIEPSSSQSVSDSGNIEFIIHFYFDDEKPRETGKVSVNANIKGEFILSGPNGFQTRATTPYNLDKASVGYWNISWIKIEGYQTPNGDSGELSASSTLSFYGNYSKNKDDPPPQPPPPPDPDPPEEPGYGTVYVKANVPAGFTLKGPDSEITNTTPYTNNKAKAGFWFIEWKEVAGYTKPSKDQKVLTSKGSITFIGNYTKNDDTPPPPPDNPPPSTYNPGDWISIGPNVNYYEEPCGRSLHKFDYVNGYQLKEKKYCDQKWWYSIWMEDENGTNNQTVWIRGIDFNGNIQAPKYNKGSTKTFKKGAEAYSTICGSVVNTIKNDGNKFKIFDMAYRCSTWWYKVYVEVWKKNVWFKEDSIQ
jgi:hypothetical protein